MWNRLDQNCAREELSSMGWRIKRPKVQLGSLDERGENSYKKTWRKRRPVSRNMRQKSNQRIRDIFYLGWCIKIDLQVSAEWLGQSVKNGRRFSRDGMTNSVLDTSMTIWFYKNHFVYIFASLISNKVWMLNKVEYYNKLPQVKMSSRVLENQAIHHLFSLFTVFGT